LVFVLDSADVSADDRGDREEDGQRDAADAEKDDERNGDTGQGPSLPCSLRGLAGQLMSTAMR
jgi:hypothetical protein